MIHDIAVKGLRSLTQATLTMLLVGVVAQGQGVPSAQRRRAMERMTSAERSLIVERNPGAAREGFISTIALDSSYAAPRFNLGLLAEAEGQWSEAERWFRAYLALDSTSEWANKAKRELQGLSRKRASADDATRRAGEYDSHIELGRRLVRSGMHADALREAQQARALETRRWEAYALAAASYQATGAIPVAMQLLDSAIARAPDTDVVRLQSMKAALGRR